VLTSNPVTESYRFADDNLHRKRESEMRHTTLLATLSAPFILAGCASAPDPMVPQVARVETTIENAEQSGARQYATKDLDMARTKLAQAELAAREGEDDVALRLAKEAELDAQVAAARAEQAEAQASLTEIQQGIETLRQEITQPGQLEGGTQ
jgi:hypothetical protein